MIKKLSIFVLFLSLFVFCGISYTQDMEIGGVKFPGEKVVAGKTLKLNGVALKKAALVIKVYAGGVYLEKPTKDAREVIESEQVKRMHLHYLTDKGTVKRIQEGFIDMMEKCNPPELVKAHRTDIERYASWLDKKTVPGKTSVTTYVPGVGLTVEYQGEVRGTIPGKEFAQMYFRYVLGDKKMKKGYLGQ
jgi:hypothetical protein